MNYYIYQNEFITSDQPLDPNEYPIGEGINDYIKGMYIPLNEEQIQYEKDNPMASPEEVLEMKPLTFHINVDTPQSKMERYFNNTYDVVYINGERHNCWDHQQILYTAQCAKDLGRTEFIFLEGSKYYKGNIDDIINMMKQIAVYYYDFRQTCNLHYRYLEKHPQEIDTYDYTTGFPEVLHFNLEEVYDSN